MTQASPKLLTVDEFITRYGDNGRYELIDGELIDMEPTGPHVRVASPKEIEVAAFVLRKVNVEIDRLSVPWFTPARCLISPLQFRENEQIVSAAFPQLSLTATEVFASASR